MIVYGLTGSIGMGKSTAAMMLRSMRVPVYDSDADVHAFLAPGGEAFEWAAVAFPEAWDKKKHSIRRNILGDIVFQDADRRKELENILHPLVQQAQKSFIRAMYAMGANKVVLDIPLLYETGADNRVDCVIVVTAPFFMQKNRVMSRAGMTEDRFYKILDTQIPDHLKRARADHIIQTGLGRAYTYRALQRIIKE